MKVSACLKSSRPIVVMLCVSLHLLEAPGHAHERNRKERERKAGRLPILQKKQKKAKGGC